MDKDAPILIACEESGTVTNAFIELGFTNVFSADILKTSGKHPNRHIVGDVLPIINGNCSVYTQDNKKHTINSQFSLLIAFPPCTYISNAGACRLYPKKGELNQERYEKGLEGKAFFMKFLEADCPKICVENPVSSTVFEMPKHSQEVQPWMFGHEVTKKTRLWLRGLPPLLPTKIVQPVKTFLPSGTGRKDKATYGAVQRKGGDALNRSKTFSGLAEAMAEQWGNYA